MNEKKNTRPAVGAAERAEENKGVTTQYLLNYNNTDQKRKQGTVEKLLLQGEKNALTSAYLVQLTGVKSARELQTMIAQERDEGALILSTCRGTGGYFLPSDGVTGQREIATFMATLQARAINTLKALKTAREALQNIKGQVSLDDLNERK